MSSLRTAWTPNRYPTARRADHVDVYESEKHGEVRVVDPYQWLEKNTEETEQWVNAQEQFTRDFLDKNPDRQILEDEIRKNTDYARVMSPTPMLVKTQEPDRVSATFYSSLPQAWNAMDDGTGPIIADCKRNQVRDKLWNASSCQPNTRVVRGANSWLHVVIYRSKDSTLPDFSSAQTGPGGEVFFDVCTLGICISRDITDSFGDVWIFL